MLNNRGISVGRLTADVARLLVISTMMALTVWPLAGCDSGAAEAAGSPAEHTAETHTPEAHDEHGQHDEDEHDAHDTHEVEEQGHEGHEDEEGALRISNEVLEEFGIEVATAAPGSLKHYIELPGEIVINADRMAHVVPRVAGIVRDVKKAVGDEVQEGELMAVIESRELAQAKAEYFGALERLELARANFEREKRLWEEKITAEREYLEAKQAMAEVRIVVRAAQQQLHALGFLESELEGLSGDPDAVYTRYEISAPIGGTIIEKHMTLGESVDPESNVFTIADLSTVWVNITVYQKDLTLVHKGQPVKIEVEHNIPDAAGTIAFVNPALDESTRTTFARVVLDNPEGHWRPGLFVTGLVERGSQSAGVVVPRSAIIEVDGEKSIFVRTGEGFIPRKVRLGSTTTQRAEVLEGLRRGEQYAATNVLTLKAQMNAAALEHAGHAH